MLGVEVYEDEVAGDRGDKVSVTSALIYPRKVTGGESYQLAHDGCGHHRRPRDEVQDRRVGHGSWPSAGTGTRFPAPERPYPLFAYRTVWEEEETTEDDDPPPETVEEEKAPSS